MNGNTWTAKEVSLLKQMWPDKSLGEIVAALPRHPKQSIQKRAAGLGIRRRKTNKRPALPILNMLWDIREAARIDRITLAENMGYHYVMLGRWERGEAMPSLQRLSDWCNALGYVLTVSKIPELSN